MAIMSDKATEFPKKCISPNCGKKLYGPVAFCPFCGVHQVTGEKQNDVVEKKTSPTIPKNNPQPLEPSDIIIPKITTKKETLPPIPKKEIPSTEPSETISPKKTDKEGKKENLEKTPNKPILILVLISFLVIAGIFTLLYLRSIKINQPSTPTPTPTSMPRPPEKGDPAKEAACSIAREALRIGTDISVPISKLTNLEKVLISAQQLLDISPRYKEQVVTAEKNLGAARDKIDKGLMSYIETVLKLNSYANKHVTYAMSILRNSDRTPREQIVVELLVEHINTLQLKGAPDPKLWLVHFKNRFSTFVD